MQKQAGGGFEVTSYDGLVKGISLYSQDKSKDASSPYVFKNLVKEYKVTDGKCVIAQGYDDVFSMEKYDGLFESKSICVLILFTLDSKVAQEKANGVTLKPYTWEENVVTKLKKTDNQMSAIVQFSYSDVLSDVSLDLSGQVIDPEAFYYQDENKNHVFSKDHVKGKNYPSVSFSSLNGDCYLGCIVEYSKDNLEYLYSLNIGNSVIDSAELDASITFKQDWGIRIS